MASTVNYTLTAERRAYIEKLHRSTFLLGYDVQVYFKITLHTCLKATSIFVCVKKGANLDTSKIFLTKA